MAVKVPPVAALGITAFKVNPKGSPEASPVTYVMVTEPMVSPFTKPVEVKAVTPVEGLAIVSPWYLRTESAVMVKGAGVISAVKPVG